MKLINTTPHTIKVLDSKNIVVTTYPPAEIPLRVEERVTRLMHAEVTPDFTVPIFSTTYAEPNLQDMKIDAGVIYITSRIVKHALNATHSYIAHLFVVPTDLVRDDGVIIGCKSFSL
jgi:hypothetical protein